MHRRHTLSTTPSTTTTGQHAATPAADAPAVPSRLPTSPSTPSLRSLVTHAGNSNSCGRRQEGGGNSGGGSSSSINKKANLYKTEFCRSYEETGACRYGAKCQFAHSPEELRTVDRHPKYKTELCRTFWERGSCPYGKRCCFLHTKGELGQTFPGAAGPSALHLLQQPSAGDRGGKGSGNGPTSALSLSLSPSSPTSRPGMQQKVRSASFRSPAGLQSPLSGLVGIHDVMPHSAPASTPRAPSFSSPGIPISPELSELGRRGRTFPSLNASPQFGAFGPEAGGLVPPFSPTSASSAAVMANAFLGGGRSLPSASFLASRRESQVPAFAHGLSAHLYERQSLPPHAQQQQHSSSTLYAGDSFLGGGGGGSSFPSVTRSPGPRSAPSTGGVRNPSLSMMADPLLLSSSPPIDLYGSSAGGPPGYFSTSIEQDVYDLSLELEGAHLHPPSSFQQHQQARLVPELGGYGLARRRSIGLKKAATIGSNMRGSMHLLGGPGFASSNPSSSAVGVGPFSTSLPGTTTSSMAAAMMTPPPPTSPIFLEAGSPFHAAAAATAAPAPRLPSLSPPSATTTSTRLRGVSISPLYTPAYEIWRDGLPLEREELSPLAHSGTSGFDEWASSGTPLSLPLPPGLGNRASPVKWSFGGSRQQ